VTCLNFAGDLVESRGDGIEPAARFRGDGLHQLVATEHQLAGQIHQLVKHADRNADVCFGGRGGRLGRRDGLDFCIRDFYRSGGLCCHGGWIVLCGGERCFQIVVGDLFRFARRAFRLPACGDRFQSLDVFANVGIVGVVNIVNQSLQSIRGAEHDVDHGGVRREFRIAHHVEDVFQGVGQIVQLGHAQEPGCALDRVDRAKDFIDQINVDVVARGFDRKELILNVGQVFVGFDYEFGDQFVVIRHG
jgi:hypothetical protein